MLLTRTTSEGRGEGCVIGAGFSNSGPGILEAKMTLIKSGV